MQVDMNLPAPTPCFNLSENVALTQGFMKLLNKNTERRGKGERLIANVQLVL